mgnify:FL=1
MHVENGRMFSHGTLMYDVDQTQIAKALTVPTDKLASKGIKSVRSRVTNLKPYMAPAYQHLTIEEFRDTLAREILGVADLSQAKTYQLDETALAGVAALNQQYFTNWDWIYGQSPAFTVKQRRHFDAGTVEFQLNVVAGRIEAVTIYGDFFGAEPIAPVVARLTGVKYERQAIMTALAPLDLTHYFGRIAPADLIDLIVAS